MWRSIANLKENISQIATDVLDSAADEDFEAKPALGRHKVSEFSEAPAREPENKPASNGVQDSELRWYKTEVSRLQTAESEIQSLSQKYVALLKEKEVAGILYSCPEGHQSLGVGNMQEEVHVLREENAEMQTRLSKEEATTASNSDAAEHKRLKDRQQVLEEQLQRTSNSQQEQLAALQENHRKRTDALIARHRRETAALQAENKALHAMSVKQEISLSNGTPDIQLAGSRVPELEISLKKAEDQLKELTRESSEKDDACAKLRQAYEVIAADLNTKDALIESHMSEKTDLHKQLQEKLVSLDAAHQEIRATKVELQRVASEVAASNKRILEQDLMQRDIHSRYQQLEADASSKIDLLNDEVHTYKERLQASKDELASAQAAAAATALRNMNGIVAAKEEVDRLKEQAQQALKLETRLEESDKRSAELDLELNAAKLERDKALRDLGRLKQHLLDVESAESEKLEEESERVIHLEARAAASDWRVASLEAELEKTKAEATAAYSRAIDLGKSSSTELVALRNELAGCLAALTAKDVELENLQSALGQYYQETETKEELRGDLRLARGQVALLSDDLKDVRRELEAVSKEAASAQEQRQQLNSQLLESQEKIGKLVEENVMLRKALEQSMTRLNRMSTDSDFYVDRRIVIKLLVTYFQRNHSKEVLDLMCRMLGFTHEDKQRVGLAQSNARGGVVRNVIGFSGKLVGGLLGPGRGDEPPLPPPDENQAGPSFHKRIMTFSDLWIDFLLKETEERERREQQQAAARREADQLRPLPSPSRSTLKDITSNGETVGTPRSPRREKQETEVAAGLLAMPPLLPSTLSSLPSKPASRALGDPIATMAQSTIEPSTPLSTTSYATKAGTGVLRSPLPAAIGSGGGGEGGYVSSGEFSPISLSNQTPPQLQPIPPAPLPTYPPYLSALSNTQPPYNH
eukprot:SM000090S24294  [mRNA]  locus=s90:103102:108573:+ [translate_table: standard]